MELTAPSGATVIINPAPWIDAKTLKKALEEQIGLTGLTLGSDLTQVLSKILLIDSSDKVDTALMACLARCLRNNEKITNETFNNVEARADYYQIAFACAKVNIGPLVESLSSLLSELGVMKKKSEEPPASA